MDAGRLDAELTNMLLEQFLKAFALIQPVRQPFAIVLITWSQAVNM